MEEVYFLFKDLFRENIVVSLINTALFYQSELGSKQLMYTDDMNSNLDYTSVYAQVYMHIYCL